MFCVPQIICTLKSSTALDFFCQWDALSRKLSSGISLERANLLDQVCPAAAGLVHVLEHLTERRAIANSIPGPILRVLE